MMGSYKRLGDKGKPEGQSQSEPTAGGKYRYIQDTPTFESLVTNAGQGTRGDKTYKIGAQEYERPRSDEDWKDVEEKGLTTERKIKRGDYGKPGMAPTDLMPPVKKARGGMIRGGGCEQRGKTRGRMV